MIRAVLFDLDDTLYPEVAYMRSGFEAVGRVLEARGLVPASVAARVFCALHLAGDRDRVIDRGLAELGLGASLAPELVAVHRDHDPTGLDLYDDVAPTLRALRPRWRLGIVSDGWLAVQRRKVAALGVAGLVDHVTLSDELGRDRWKPDSAPFLRCLDALGGIAPSEAVMVGDNPSRDLTGAQALGMACILVARPDAFGFASTVEIPGVPRVTSLLSLPSALAGLDVPGDRAHA